MNCWYDLLSAGNGFIFINGDLNEVLILSPKNELRRLAECIEAEIC